MNQSKTLGLSIVLLLIFGLSIARSETIRQFRDWRAVCDNLNNCKAVSVDLAPASRLEIARKYGRDTFWTLSFIITGDEARTYEPFHISVDFEEPLTLEPDDGYRSALEPNRFDIINIRQANRLMQLFARGRQTYFNFLNRQGQETGARFSLKGLSASLLWIDDRQKRLKSPRTIGVATPVSTNEKPEKTNPFISGNTRVLAPDKIPPALAALHFADGECASAERQPFAGFGFETAKLDDGHKLYLIPCFAGAYNVVYRIYLKSASRTKPRQLFFASYSDELGWSGTPELMNISYDAKTETLSTLAKSRGLGDCGSRALYKWNLYAFKMVEYRYWGKCDGTRLPADWPVIYPTP